MGFSNSTIADELRQIIEDAAHHPFGRRLGYGRGDGKYDDCYDCLREALDRK